LLKQSLKELAEVAAMRKGSVAFMALALVGLALASCGRYQREQRAAWRDEAEAACMARGEVRTSAFVSLRGSPIEGPGTCGMVKPLRVSAFAGGAVGVTSTQTLSCPIVSTTDKFLAEVVQPAAMNVLGAQVIEMRAGSYSCRAMNNGTGTSRRSEHSYGNALDIFSFRLSDGREVTVRQGWNGQPAEQDFLREVFIGACRYYKTVLGPGADMFHYDHFHVDLARHNGGRAICRPLIKHTPRRDLNPRDLGPRELVPRDVTAFDRSPPPAAGRAAPASSAVAMSSPRRDFEPQPGMGGPIRLPGSVAAREELVVGHGEADLIDPDNDPFAAEEPARGPRPMQPSALPPAQPAGPPPARTGWSVGPQPLNLAPMTPRQPAERFQPDRAAQEQPAAGRPWPPRF
jgi:hypothetical protein